MSLLIAMKTKTEAWIVYDSFMGTDDEIFITSTPKAYKDAGGGIIGAIGLSGGVNRAKDLSVGSPTAREVQAVLASWREQDADSADETDIIMVRPERPIVVVTSKGYWSPVEDWYAAGAGVDMARGYFTARPPASPKDLVACIKAIAKLSPKVSEPIHTLHVSLTPKPTKKRTPKESASGTKNDN
jgi:hypothetical protein